MKRMKFAVRCTMSLRASEILGQQCFPSIFKDSPEKYREEEADLSLPGWVYCMGAFLVFIVFWALFAWISAFRHHWGEE